MEVFINGKEIQVPEHSSVLDSINISGTAISQLCKDPDMKPIGACRTCLVEIEGVRGYPASCSTPISQGMKISTTGNKLDLIRKSVLELTAGMVHSDKDDYKELSRVMESNSISGQVW